MANNINMPAFSPGASTVNLAATGTTSNVQVTPTGSYARNVRIYNSGTSIVFVHFGADNTVTATTTASMPIAPGTVEVFSCPRDWVAAITSGGSSTIYFTAGEGQ